MSAYCLAERAPVMEPVDVHNPILARKGHRSRELNHFQAAHGAGARCELVLVQSHALEHGHKQIGERVVVFGVERQNVGRA